MIKDKMVSVIIPCYLQTNYLNESIKSVLNQTYDNFEIIVVDDGSPDHVEDITINYPQVKLIKQSNQGAAVARNNGMYHSKGDYLIFLDADDRLLPNALQIGVTFLQSRPDCAFVTGFIQEINSDGEFLQIPAQRRIEKEHFKILLQSNYIWTPGAVMYQKSIFNSQKAFDRNAGGSADYELNIRIARTSPIGCHGEIVLEYRKHSENMSGNLSYMLKSGVGVRRAGYKYIKHDPKLVSAWREGIKIVQQDVGNRFLSQIGKRKKSFFTDFWYLLKYYPNGIKTLIKKKVKLLKIFN